MRRILLHLGFHKTGTTAAQSFLFENRELIWPRHALILPYRTRKTGLSEAATRYSVYGTAGALGDFGNQMGKFLKSLEFGTRRGLILSEENFSGLRPSRNAAVGYEAASDLAACLVDLIQYRFAGEQTDITVYLSLRQRGSWLRSLWVHDLQRTRLAQGFDDFRKRLDHVPSPQAAATQIRNRLSGITVKTEWLEDMQDRRFGPGSPFAEFLKPSAETTASLKDPTRANPRLPQDVLHELLDLNRSSLEDTELFSRKSELVDRARNNLIGTI